MTTRLLPALTLLLLAGCATSSSVSDARSAPDPLGGWFDDSPPLRVFARRAAKLRLQIVVGWLEESPGAPPRLRQATFRAGAEYFYPASAIKTFAAVAALERLAEIRRETGLPIDRGTPLAIHPLFAGETLQDADPTHLANGKITVAQEIRKLAIVSDNEAFNRLYALAGQDGIAASLAHAGLDAPRIVHRLSRPMTPEENRRLPRIDFAADGFTHTLAARESAPLPPPPTIPRLLAGRAYLTGDRRVDRPMDFATKNRFSLIDLQRGLCKLVRPDAACGGGGPFALADDDRAFLLGAMSEVPRASTDPVFDPVAYPDSWGKFLLPGLLRVLPEERWRIVNKIGRAYGFSTENAWIEERASGRSLFVAATLYTNSDGVLNDDRYDYDTVASPFFAALGEAAGRALAESAAQPKKR